MHAGNVSPSHPVDTILEAARRLQRVEPAVAFVFVGGGEGMGRVRDFVTRENLSNVRILPYQPLEQLRYSLSAADVHLVAMGDDMVGVCHPCKLYGAMAAARPVFLVGPRESHAGEIIEEWGNGWIVPHGRSDLAAETIMRIRHMAPGRVDSLGIEGHRAVAARFSRIDLLGSFCDLLEASISG
jgi:glycosyltransferase involved in cell wall biosynthesis